MRVGFLADSHFAEGPLFPEARQIHEWIVRDARTRRVELMIHGGDVFDHPATTREMSTAIEFFLHVSKDCPVIIVRGNHDEAEDLDVLASMPTDWPVIVELDSHIHHVATGKGRMTSVLAVAWGHPVRGHLTRSRPSETLILAGHLMVRGAVPPITETIQYSLLPGSAEVPMAELVDTGADIAMLGHLHAREDWVEDGMPILYSGCPRRLNPGDAEPKCYVVADVTQESVQWARVEIPPGGKA